MSSQLYLQQPENVKKKKISLNNLEVLANNDLNFSKKNYENVVDIFINTLIAFSSPLSKTI